MDERILTLIVFFSAVLALVALHDKDGVSVPEATRGELFAQDPIWYRAARLPRCGRQDVSELVLFPVRIRRLELEH